MVQRLSMFSQKLCPGYSICSTQWLLTYFWNYCTVFCVINTPNEVSLVTYFKYTPQSRSKVIWCFKCYDQYIFFFPRERNSQTVLLTCIPVCKEYIHVFTFTYMKILKSVDHIFLLVLGFTFYILILHAHFTSNVRRPWICLCLNVGCMCRTWHN